MDIIKKLPENSWFLTYQDPNQFPDLKFIELKRIVVPNIRKGGVIERYEYISTGFK